MSVLQEYKCPCCGGALEFNSSVQKMKCPFCDTEFEMEALEAYDNQLNSEQQSDMTWDANAGQQWGEGEADGLRTYVCKSCGGEIIGDETTAATSCPYCDNPIVLMGQFSGSLKPDYVIPFKQDKKAAISGLKKHYEGKILLPKVFKDQNHIEEVKGVYVPFWLFDADATASIRYKATKERKWSDSNYDYTETSYYSVQRGGYIGFNTVPVDGSSKMPDELMESVEPYNFSDAVPFQTAYLAGYLADKYDVTDAESVERANERIKKSTEEEFRKTVTGYNTVTTENTYINLQNAQAKYALYPVWMLNTQWNGKKYTFAMNGQTGKMVGDLPCDNKKYWLLTFVIMAVLALVVFGLSFLMEFLSSPIVIAIIAVAGAFITTGIMRGQLKSVGFKSNATDYVRKGSFKVTERNDFFMYRKVDRREKPKNNN